MFSIPPPRGFYPEDPGQLREMIDEFWEKAQPEFPPQKLKGLILPHAGLFYSGLTATYGYKILSHTHPQVVLIIAQSHYLHFSGLRLLPQGRFTTPIGNLPIDDKLTQELFASCQSHMKLTEEGFIILNGRSVEHAIAVHIPLLIIAVPEVRLVAALIDRPILKGRRDIDHTDPAMEELASAIGQWLERYDGIIIASTDLSHFYPRDVANRCDKLTLSLIIDGDPSAFARGVADGNGEACGSTAVELLMKVMAQSGKVNYQLLHYSDSADADPSLVDSVVGYASIAIWQG